MIRTPRACGARRGEFVACFSGSARKTRHKLTQKAREAGQESEKEDYSQALGMLNNAMCKLFCEREGREGGGAPA